MKSIHEETHNQNIKSNRSLLKREEEEEQDNDVTKARPGIYIYIYIHRPCDRTGCVGLTEVLGACP